MIDVYQQQGINLLPSIMDTLERKTGQKIHQAGSISIPQTAYDPFRRQYDALKIIHAVAAERTVHHDPGLCIVADDIFIHRMNFVFGLAAPAARTAIVSTYRLNGSRLSGRLTKEITHELGHLTGLGHCADPRCVMHCSNTLNDTDQKTADLCRICRSVNG